MRAPRRARGFTLVETGVVVSMFGVLAALSYSAYDGAKERAAARNGLGEISAAIHRARTEAFSRGAPAVFFLRPVAGGGLEYGVVADLDADFDPADVATSLEATDLQIVPRKKVPTGVLLTPPSSSFFAQPLPAPFTAVPADRPCTFCDDSNTVVVAFTSDGRARLGAKPEDHPRGGSFTLAAVGLAQETVERQTLAVLSRSGSVTSFDRAGAP